MRTRLTLLLLACLAAFALGACGDAEYTGEDDGACGEYDLGDSWDADDGCNTCTCTEMGAACTLLACVGPDVCDDRAVGETWSDGCNTCTCTEDGATCTTMGCNDPCEGREPGASFPADDNCNTCFCDENGQVLCTEMACTEPVCEEIGDAFAQAIGDNQGCEVDSDCTEVFTRCVWVDVPGAYGCTAPINTSADQDAIRALAQDYTDAGCNGGFCDCAPSPPVACVENTCAFVESDDCDGTPNGTTWETEDGCSCVCDAGQVFCDCLPIGCGDYEIGESWQDGCAECICTEEGPVCEAVECPPEGCGEYGIGESWDDGCNTCTCTEDGAVCTQRACVDECEGREPGESFPADDGCNTCFCDEGGNISCTEIACSPCDRYEPGEMFPAGDGCNTCVCDEDGGMSCTEAECGGVCQDVVDIYRAILESQYGPQGDARTCEQDTDCGVYNGHCGIGLGGCYIIANTTAGSAELDQLAEGFASEGCTGPVCSCAPPPEVGCVEGYCEALDTPPLGCGEYGIGESWDDGCNTCTCTEDGPVCTDAVCPDPCEGREPGESFPADDGCNTCFCDEDGGMSCTELECSNSCEDIEAEYRDLVTSNQSCQRPDDCQILWGQCGVGLGGCYEAVNASISQDDLNTLGAQYSHTGCTSAVCDCAEPPEVDCVENTCVMLF